MSDPLPLQLESTSDSGPVRLETFFSGAYPIFRTNIDANIQDGMDVLDLGSKDGTWDVWIDHKSNNSTITLVDIDRSQLDVFKHDHFKRRKRNAHLYGQQNKFKVVCEDINTYLKKVPADSRDLILFNATLHEANDPEHQEEYLQSFFGQIKRILRSGKRIIVGDYFAGPDVSDEQYKSLMEFQEKNIGHADAREKFVDPELVKKVAEGLGLKTVVYENVQVHEEINRRYYLFVFEK